MSGAPARRDFEKLRPVPCDLLLSFSEIHRSVLHLRGQVVLDHILLLEIALAQRAADNLRFWGFIGWAFCCFSAAHLALCAAAILARPALLIVRRFCGPA